MEIGNILTYAQSKLNSLTIDCLLLQSHRFLGNEMKSIVFDLDGTLAIEWGAYGVPESFLIHNNEIIKKYIGPLNQKLVDEINLFIK